MSNNINLKAQHSKIVKDASMISTILKAEADLVSKRLARQEERFSRLKFIENQQKSLELKNENNLKMASFIDLTKNKEELLTDPKYLLDGYHACFDQYQSCLGIIKNLQNNQLVNEQEIENLKDSYEQLNTNKLLLEQQITILKTKFSQFNHSHTNVQRDYSHVLQKMLVYENIIKFKKLDINEIINEMESNPNTIEDQVENSSISSLNNLSFDLSTDSKENLSKPLVLLSLFERVKILVDNQLSVSERDFFNYEIQRLGSIVDKLQTNQQPEIKQKSEPSSPLSDRPSDHYYHSKDNQNLRSEIMIESLKKDLVGAESKVESLKLEKRQLTSDVNKLKMTILDLECERDSCKRRLERMSKN